MKTIVTLSMVFVAALCLNASAQTQPKKAKHTIANYETNNFNNVDDKNGKLTGHVRSNSQGVEYEMRLVDDKLTELYVDDKKIPADQWGKYDDDVKALIKQVKIDLAQARKDQAQARLDQEQARKDQAQARLDQEQARRDQEQAGRDQEQARKDQAQARIDQEGARKDQEQARRDQEQAGRDQEQAKKDQAQARLDQIQARKDQEQAKEDQRLMRQMIADLVADKIVPDEKSVRNITINSTEMTVNGTKVSDAIFKKYKAKYARFSHYNFSFGYNNGDGFTGVHISKLDDSQ